MYVELNVFALIILLLIFINVHHQKEKYFIDQKLFLALIDMNAFVIIFNTLIRGLDGKTGPFMRELHLIITVLYFIANPIICMLWACYAEYQIFRDESRLKTVSLLALPPVLINTVFSVLSISGNYLFYIDQNNVYHRGAFFYIVVSISYVFLVATVISIVVNRKKLQKDVYIPILLFALPPFIGSIVQILYNGIPLIWLCMTISILMVFINVQNQELYTDHLTGLFNRRQLDCYIQAKMQSTRTKGFLGGIMIDVDSFKMINDRYGHTVGDQALKAVADILKDSFRKIDFIARYGGDEFVVLLELENELDIINAVERLNQNVDRFNLKRNTPFSLALSIGVDSFDYKSKITSEEFMKRIDRLMYNDKMDKKGLKEA